MDFTSKVPIRLFVFFIIFHFEIATCIFIIKTFSIKTVISVFINFLSDYDTLCELLTIHFQYIYWSIAKVKYIIINSDWNEKRDTFMFYI